jgi:hypothetical protein
MATLGPPPSPTRPRHPGAPPRPVPPGAPSGPVRPWPHPPGPALPAAPLGPAGLGRAGAELLRRAPLLGGALLGAALLWWAWNQFKPAEPAPEPPAEGRSGELRVIVVYEQCSQPQGYQCLAWGGGEVEQVEYVFLFNHLMAPVAWVSGRVGPYFKVKIRATYPAYPSAGVIQQEDVVGEGITGLVVRPLRVRFVKVFSDGGPDKELDEPWRSLPEVEDPFAPGGGDRGPKPFPAPAPLPAPAFPLRPPAVPVRPSPPVAPAAPPGLDPLPGPAPETQPARPPAPLLPVAPPGVGTGGGPGARPFPVVPGSGAGVAPASTPGAQGSRPTAPSMAPLIRPLLPGPVLRPDGTVEPQPQLDPGVKQTPSTGHIVGTEVFGRPELRPAPTMQGLAIELGRVEEKLAWVIIRLQQAGGASCQFVDRTDEVLEVIESLQVDVDDIAEKIDPLTGPLAMVAEAPADFLSDGSRVSFEFDIPRVKASEFQSLYLRRQAEYALWLQGLRGFVAKRPPGAPPIRITWEAIPYSE